MDGGARTPEELETLLEDAFVLQDHHALAQLFQPDASLVVGGGLPDARGHEQIRGVATQLWDLDRCYIADARRILQVRDTALVVAGRAINVARRGGDGFWRYTISLLDLGQSVAAVTCAWGVER
jgi:hypothetical protein